MMRHGRLAITALALMFTVGCGATYANEEFYENAPIATIEWRGTTCDVLVGGSTPVLLGCAGEPRW